MIYEKIYIPFEEIQIRIGQFSSLYATILFKIRQIIVLQFVNSFRIINFTQLQCIFAECNTIENVPVVSRCNESGFLSNIPAVNSDKFFWKKILFLNLQLFFRNYNLISEAILMMEPLKGNEKSLAYSLFKGMHEDNLEYTYRGIFTSTITDTILSLAETNLDNAEETRKVKKRVYFIMVEGLQNITRHQTENLEDKDVSDYPGLFVLQRNGSEGYSITTGNLIQKDNRNLLKEQINKINSLDKGELKKYSLEILDQGSLSTKGGAGLGLIEIARKSGNKIHFDFKDISDEFAFFYMNTRISASKGSKNDDNPLPGIIELHEILENQNILLNFSGIFNQETLINLLSIIEKQLKGTIILKMKVFNLMVEMLQNIVKHADNYNYKGERGKHAIFYISESEDKIIFTSGNYIKNNKIESFRDRLEKINNLDKESLSAFYNQTLFNFDKNNDMHTGLGLIDIKMKCKMPYVFDFYKINDDFSFYSLQIHVKKMKSELSPLIIEKESDKPEVSLDSNTGVMQFSGRSIAENAFSFYAPILDWIKKYRKNPCSFTEVIFNFDYYNTATEKQIAKIMVELENIASDNNKLVIKWHYYEGDHSMLSHGLRFKELLTLDIQMVEDELPEDEEPEM